MRLIDADKVQMKLFEECQNIRYFDKDRKKPQIFADGIDFAWVMLDNTPTVDAIPIEWIDMFMQRYKIQGTDEYKLLHFMVTEWKKWEKENGRLC